jgi:hypothetical protein
MKKQKTRADKKKAGSKPKGAVKVAAKSLAKSKAGKKPASKAVSDIAYVAGEGVISRRNQDGTVILMSLGDVSLFCKIESLAASVWGELSKAKTAAGLVKHFAKLLPKHSERLAKDIPALLAGLVKAKLVQVVSAAGADKSFLIDKVEMAKYEFGSLRSFNLEEIENEVLNESIYLDVFAGSDLRLKTEVVPIEGALAKVLSLDGIHFKWDDVSIRRTGARVRPSKRMQTGLIAQQVVDQCPELVRSDVKTGVLAVNYAKLNAYLVEALKELNGKIDAQNQKIKTLQKRLKRVSEES